MSKIQFIVDSTVDLEPERMKALDLVVLPLEVHIDGKVYKDDPSEFTARELFDIMDRTQTLPKTSAVAPSAFLDAFNKAEEEGCDGIIFIGLGSFLSSTYQNAHIAKDAFKGKAKIRIIDSINLSTGTGLIVLYGKDYEAKGHNVDEVADYMESLVPRSRAQFVVHSLDVIYRGGRINSAKYLFGKMLRAHPFIQVNVAKNQLEVAATPKGKFKKALDYQFDVFMNDYKKGILEDHVYITHTCNPEARDYYYDKMKDMFPEGVLKTLQTGTVISSHCGEGTIGILYIMKE